MDLRLYELLDDVSKDATITMWHVKENDIISEGQDIFEVVTDKATFDVFAPCQGVLTEILKREGDSVKADDVIARIAEI